VDGRVALALGTMDRRLFRYGRTAPLTPMTTPARRSHHPRPGPQDQVTPGHGWADPQKPPIAKVPTSVVADPGIATIGSKRAKSATPSTTRLKMSRLIVGIWREHSKRTRARTTATTT